MRRLRRHLILCLALGVQFASAGAQDKPDLKDPKQRISYSVGVDIGQGMKRRGLDLDARALYAGIVDGLGGKPALSPVQVEQALDELKDQVRQKKAAQDLETAQKNLKAGEAFLAANASKDGVKTLTNGLQYKVLKPGSGQTPKPTDTVKVRYQGALIDGTVFDRSGEQGEPASFRADQTLPGLTQALLRMKEGDRWQVFVPPGLAYGVTVEDPKIGPNSVLVFDLELLAIEKEPKAKE